MTLWMIYVIAVSMVLSLAALAGERALRLRRGATRWPWAAALLASLLLPTLIASVTIQVPDISSPTRPGKMIALREVTSLPLPLLWQLPQHPQSMKATPNPDAWLKRAWIAVSALMLLALLASAAQVFWRKRGWARSTMAGVSVYVARDVGPAVVGLLRPRIVVPRWMRTWSEASQAHVISHEQSHITAHDPQLLTLALFLVMLMPWNLPLWWQVRRLRHAIEIDCDARVLQAGHDVSRYGETLIEVGRRQSAFIGSVAAMSESASLLEQRIRIMIRKPTSWWRMSAALLGSVSVALVTLAAQVSPPNAGSAADGTPKEVQVDPTLYDGYVGHYKFGESAIMTVSRDGNHLVTRLSGQGPVEIFPSGKTEFFAKIVKARINFTTDAQGHATALTLLQNEHTITAPRMDDQAAQQIEDRLTARVQSQTPQPGTEAALRQLIAGLTLGKPNYDAMTPELAQATREQLPKLQKGLEDVGAVQSVEFRGVGPGGWDVYDVHHEKGITTWRLVLNTEGKVSGALVRPGP